VALSSTLGLELRTAAIVLVFAGLTFAVVLAVLFKPKLGAIFERALDAAKWVLMYGIWLAFIALLLILALRVGRGKLDPDAAAVAAVLLIGTGALMSLGTSAGRKLLGRIGKASVGPVALEFVSEAREAAGLYAESEQETTKDGEEPLESLLSLRLRLEAKLAYIAKHLLTEDGDHPRHATFVTIGSLREDKLITEKEAHTATRIMVLREEELDAIDPREKQIFLVSATNVVDNIRASVHYGRVKKLLKSKGWFVVELPRGKLRPDLWAEKGDTCLRVVPRFEAGKKNLDKQITRLEERAKVPRVRRRLIVIPDRADQARVRSGELDPLVVKFSSLPRTISLLKEPKMLADSKATNGFAVDDLEAAKQFYGETLGLNYTVLSEENGLISLHMADGRDTLVYLKPDFTPATYTILNFEVDDIESAVDELISRGVSMERYEGFEQDEKGIAHGPGPHIAWFEDPAGNILSVLQQPSSS